MNRGLAGPKLKLVPFVCQTGAVFEKTRNCRGDGYLRRMAKSRFAQRWFPPPSAPVQCPAASVDAADASDYYREVRSVCPTERRMAHSFAGH